jgi:hypothetical protein
VVGGKGRGVRGVRGMGGWLVGLVVEFCVEGGLETLD